MVNEGVEFQHKQLLHDGLNVNYLDAGGFE